MESYERVEGLVGDLFRYHIRKRFLYLWPEY
jgi:hypothetical protein